MRRQAALLALVATGIGGCGGSGSHRSAARQSTAAASIALLQTADCNLWRVMDVAGRQRLLTGFRSFFGRQVDAASRSGQRGPVLDDRHATRLFDGYCRQSFAGAFKLYKLYGRAAAFGGA